MRKSFFVLLLFLCQVFFINAQNITGKTWVADIPNEDGFILSFKFEKSGKVTTVMESEGDMDITMTITGTYKKSGNKLVIKYKQPVIDLQYDSCNEDDLGCQMVSTFVENLNEQAKQNMGYYKTVVYKIKKITKSTLELSTKSNTMKFKAK